MVCDSQVYPLNTLLDVSKIDGLLVGKRNVRIEFSRRQKYNNTVVSWLFFKIR